MAGSASSEVTGTTPRLVVDLTGIDTLISVLRSQGYHTLGPTVRDGAIVLDELDGAAALPVGVTDVQEAGTYRLVPRDDGALFGYAVGPVSPKRSLFPPIQLLFTARREGDVTFEVEAAEHEPDRIALIGVRACELAAIDVQDRVFLGGPYRDRVYSDKRRDLLVVAVNCAEPGGTCFCASMGTGPAVTDGHDVVITELLDSSRHEFLLAADTDRGRSLLERLPGRPPGPEDLEAAAAVVERARRRMGRRLDTDGLPEALMANAEHPHWDEVAERCLTCGNCTLVCPTCFCTNVEDTTDLAGGTAERRRRWDSCFTIEFTHIGPSSVRTSARARYRQWLTHKLSTWVEQFGTSGCVGCGRCITWCPVGIDITAEAHALSEPPALAPAPNTGVGRTTTGEVP